MENSLAAGTQIEMWGGAECTLNRVGAQYFDQVERTGHGERVDDLDRFASIGVAALRYPVLWERVAPDSLDQPSWTWTDERLGRIATLGIRPIVGLLHHGSGPQYTSLLDPQFPAQLARYAGMVARRYPWVVDYTPVNEPLTTARFSALYGIWHPHGCSDRAFVRALLHQVRGVVLAMRAIREVNSDARLVQTEDCGRCYGTWRTRQQAAFENHRRWLTWDLLAGRVDRAHPLRGYLLANGATSVELDDFTRRPTPPQVIGLNYYLTSDRFLDHRLKRFPERTHGGNGHIAYADVEAVRARPRGIAGHEAHLIAAWERYGVPVALTEVHLACTREEQVRWLHDAWHGAHCARERGADVIAVTAWALLGSYDWDSLVTAPRGHYESGAFDLRTTEPRPTAVAHVIRALATHESIDHVALAGPGWWRRPERLSHQAEQPNASPNHCGQPLLIVGAAGTLGKAFVRIAAARGLSVQCMTRADMDITDAGAVADALTRIQPWAVINAAGYVRVDAAEQQSAACFDVNTVGALNLASTCQRMDIAFVTYSSDLVFSGESDRPYTEDDRPCPLNVYGASKAEAEWRVLDALPQALIIRTSAFFSAWDAHNFAARTLDTIRRGERWRAASDIIVSPTYVPDLVHATLDLLLDRESGIWHLANDSAVSWFEFARSVASVCREDSDLIVPASGAALGWAAPRPRYSVLASVRGRVMRSGADALTAFASAQTQRIAVEH